MDMLTLALAKEYTDEKQKELLEALPEDTTATGVEVADIRKGYDGAVYETAGEAVRGQMEKLREEMGSPVTSARVFPAQGYTITFAKNADASVTITLPTILYVEYHSTNYVTRIDVATDANAFNVPNTQLLCYSVSVGVFGVYTEAQYGAAKDDLVPCAFNHYGSIRGQWEIYTIEDSLQEEIQGVAIKDCRVFPAMAYNITFVKNDDNSVTITLPSILYIENATNYLTRINVATDANTFTVPNNHMLCYSVSAGVFGVYTEAQYGAAKSDLVPCAFNHYGNIRGQWEMYAACITTETLSKSYAMKRCSFILGYTQENYSANIQRYINFEYNLTNKAYDMTIPQGTILVYGTDTKNTYTVSVETVVNLNSILTNEKIVIFDTATGAFSVKAATSAIPNTAFVVCVVKSNDKQLSVDISAPYTINGCLPGMESVYNTVDNVKYLLGFVIGDIRNATDTLYYAQTKRMAMKSVMCLDYDITVMYSNLRHYLYVYDDENGTNGVSKGIINEAGNYTIKAGTYFRLTAYLKSNEAPIIPDPYNNAVFNEIRIYRTDALRQGFEVAFAPYERYTNTNIRAVSHRGLNRVAPENTLPAYVEARKAGFEYAETDVAFTKDGYAVLLHDITVDRTSDGTGNIKDLTFAQVRAMDFGSWFSPAYAGTQIPTFEEFISLCKKIGLKPYVELREMTAEQAQSLVTIVKRYGMAKQTTWICTSTVTLSAISEAYPAARLGLGCGTLTEALVSSATALRNDHNDVFIDTSDTSANAVSLMMAADIEGEVWTVWTEAAINSLNPYFTGVTSDNLVAGSVLYKSTMAQYE